MNSEKRMIGDYEVILTAWLGDKEYLIDEDSNDASKHRYMACVNISNEIYTDYENVVGSDDYLEVFKLYLDRLRELETKRSKWGITNILTAEDCVHGGLDGDINDHQAGNISAGIPNSRHAITDCKQRFRVSPKLKK